MKLFDWQTKCLRAWELNHHRGIVNAVTGSGKTMLALAAISSLSRKYPDLRVRIVVPTIPLANQWYQSLLHNASCEEELPGVIGGGSCEDSSRRFLIYIVNTARTTLSKHILKDLALNHHVFLICDECHHYQSPENRRIFDFLNKPDTILQRNPSLYCCMGLSATPFQTNADRFLRTALGREIYTFGFQDAKQDGIISAFSICHVSASFLPEEAKRYATATDLLNSALAKLLSKYPYLRDLPGKRFLKEVNSIAHKADMDISNSAAAFLMAAYRRKEISVLANSRIFCCMSLIAGLPVSSRILVFCERISQAESLYQHLERKYGPVIAIYHSKMTGSARNRVLSAFRSNTVRILITCKCLDEGIDVPDAQIGIVLSSSSVSRQRIQRLGRILRRNPDKSSACLYYLYIRESADDRVYLDSPEDFPTFHLRYFPQEKAFSNELYECAAALLLKDTKEKGASSPFTKELRSCILEGLTRSDYLLDPALQKRLHSLAPGVHERNYWLTMQKIGSILRRTNS